MHILSLKNPSDATLASIEHCDIYKMSSKMEANYKLKNFVIWKIVSNQLFP